MTDDLDVWTEVLTRFERALDTVGEPPDAPAFALPSGPPPEELVEWCRTVLARQHAAISGLTVSRADVARELSLLRRVPSGSTGAPVYLDVEG